MINAEDPSEPVIQSSVDRLVDGDLGHAERRELLLRLENDPDGWRRCALAFLEDQAWREAIDRPSVLADPAPQPIRPVHARRSSIRRFSIAASVLVATFAAGLAVGGVRRIQPMVEVARPEDSPKPKPSDSVQPEPIREVGSIQLVDNSAGESPPVRVPILSGPGLDEQWLRDRPASVPEYIRAQWERQGYQVEERRRLVSVVLEDGRRVSIPVNEVALQFVGQETF